MLQAREVEATRELLEKIADANLVDKMFATYGMASTVLGSYYQRWRTDFEAKEWVSLEHEFAVPYTDIYNFAGQQLPAIILRGKIDGIIRDKSGKIWLFETKTKARIDDDAIVERLGFDLQVGIYSWAIKQLFGVQPEGVVYNLIRRPQLRKGAKETDDQFITRCYEDVLDRPEWYFLRYEVKILQDEVDKFQEELSTILARISEWYSTDSNYRNSTSCYTGWAPCGFLKTCASGNKSELIKREKMFSELAVIPVQAALKKV